MITKTELLRWQNWETDAQPEILDAMRVVHTPQTMQGRGLLVAGLEDGAIVHLKGSDGKLHHIQLNAHLALLLAKDLLAVGMEEDWIAKGLVIKTASDPEPNET